MVLENATIIIGIAVAISYFIVYKKTQLFGSLSMMGTGILTFYYSKTGSTDPTAYGILGSIIFGTSLILLIAYLFSPAKKRKYH